MSDTVHDLLQQSVLDEVTQFNNSKTIHEKVSDVVSRADQIRTRLSDTDLDDKTLAASLKTLDAATTAAHVRSAKGLFDRFREMPVDHGAIVFKSMRNNIEAHLAAARAGMEALDESKTLSPASIGKILDGKYEQASFFSAQNKFLRYLKLTDKSDTGIYDTYHREIIEHLKDAKKEVTDLRKPKDGKSTAADGDFATPQDLDNPRRAAHSRAAEEALREVETKRRELSIKNISAIFNDISSHLAIAGEKENEARIAAARKKAHIDSFEEGLSRIARTSKKTTGKKFNALVRNTGLHAELSESPHHISEAKRWIAHHIGRIRGEHYSISASWSVDVPSPDELKAPPYRTPQRPDPVAIPYIEPPGEKLDMSPPGKGKGMTKSDKKQPGRKP